MTDNDNDLQDFDDYETEEQNEGDEDVEVVPDVDPENTDEQLVEEYRERRTTIEPAIDPMAEIKIGDVCHDLVERGKVYVVDKPANSVAEFREREDFDLAGYKSHPLIRVSDNDPVYSCVYLPENPTVSFSGTYDFPASRLARIPVEEANKDLDRVQVGLSVNLAKWLLRAYDDMDVDDDVHRLEVAIEQVLGAERADLVFELTDVEQRFGGDDDGE